MTRKLSKAIPKALVKDMLHSMAASQTILFWNSKGEMVQNEQRVPRTNMAKLLDYVLLSFNSKLEQPSGYKIFINGLAEVGIDKKLVENKKALADLIKSENDLEEASESSSEESEDESEDDGSQSGGGEKTDTVCGYCEGENVNNTFLAACPKCFWNDSFRDGYSQAERPICESTFPLDNRTLKDMIQHCPDCGLLQHYSYENQRLIQLLKPRKERF